MPSYQLKRATARLKLENGRDTEGNLITKNLSLGDLNETYVSANKADTATKLLAITAAIGPCLSKDIASLELVEEQTIVNS